MMSWFVKILFLLAYYVHGYADVSRYRECIESGTNPETIVRDTQMRIWYSLGATSTYRGFPQLNDKFYLKTTQRVKISYKINTWFPSQNLFWTKLKVDGVVRSQYNYVTTMTYERTHQFSDLLWLKKGWHTVEVVYRAGVATANQPPNDHGEDYQFSNLVVQYLDYSPNQTD